MFFLGLNLVFAGTVALTKEKVEQALRQELRATYQDLAAEEISLNILIKPAQQKLFLLTTDNYRLQFFLPRRQELNSRSKAKLSIYEGPTLNNTFLLPFRLQIFSDVFYAQDSLPTGTRLLPEYFYTKKTDILIYDQQLVGSKNNLQGKILNGPIAADRPLYKWQVKESPLVNPGEKVEVLFIFPELQLKMTAIALQQGALGDKVRVQLCQTQKVFKAEVISRAHCLVRM